jgi:hypothetical protein
MSSSGDKKRQGEHREPWEPMALTDVGNVRDVVQGGTGKTTTTVGDPGEPKKVQS